MTTKQANWIKFTGSDEQIAEMRNGFISRDINGEQCTLPKYASMFVCDDHMRNCLKSCGAVEILICNPHPLADMICHQARTGQPVYIQGTRESENGLQMEWFSIKTTKPNWYLNAEYSFTESKGEV